MKKRLISMLMAVLMIASLLPASAVLADTTAAECNHTNKTVTVMEKDAENKVPGIKATVCTKCGEVTNVTITRFKDDKWYTLLKCKHETSKVVEVQKAACEQFGLKVSYCVDCGEAVPTKDLAGADGEKAVFKAEKPLAHNYDKFTVQVYPTCTKDGWGYVECTLCGDPKFVANANAAVDELKASNYATAAAYQARYNEVKALFIMTDKEHDGTKFVTVTREITGFVDDNGQTRTLEPARDYVHKNTISGKYDATKNEIIKSNSTSDVKEYKASVSGTTITFTETTALDAVVSRSADKYCASCHKVIEGNENTSETHSPLGTEPDKLGYAPYIDKNGYPHDGKTDTWKCATCGEQYGGITLDFDEYFNFNNTNDLKKDRYSVSDIVIPGKAATCYADGQTDTVLEFDKTEGKWTIKQVGAPITTRPAHNMVDVAAVDPDCKTGTEGCIYTNYKKCTNEGCTKVEGSANNKIDIPANHTWKETVLVEATCTHTGIAVEKCTKCQSYKLTDDKNNVAKTILEKKTTHVAAAELANVKEATCLEKGYTGDKVCKFCGYVMEAGKETKLGDHTPVAVDAKAPTCTEPGVTKGTVCKVCEKVLEAQKTDPALGHQTELRDAKAATCTEAGYTGDQYCTRCKTVVEKGKALTKLEHQTELRDAKAATCTEAGYTGDKYCTLCKTVVEKGTATKALEHNYVNGLCSRCDAKQPGYMPFTDVKTSDQFYKDILWAYENGVVEGDDTGMFRGDSQLTRAQVVTMLWRMNDKPKATKSASFNDLTQNWYKEAVAWAVEQNIVKGVGDNKFAPNDTCTRAQIVTMLWRLNGSTKVTPTINFTDLTQDWYKDAVAWAANNGITKGDGASHFYPSDNCTRGQAAAFIHRTAALNK